MVVSVGANVAAISFMNLGLIWSGPAAMWGARLLRSFKTPSVVIWMSGAVGNGLEGNETSCVAVWSFVKTDSNWRLRISAFPRASNTS